MEVFNKLVFVGIPALSEEATNIFIWCLAQNPDCYKQWVSFSVGILNSNIITIFWN